MENEMSLIWVGGVLIRLKSRVHRYCTVDIAYVDNIQDGTYE